MEQLVPLGLQGYEAGLDLGLPSAWRGDLPPPSHTKTKNCSPVVV